MPPWWGERDTKLFLKASHSPQIASGRVYPVVLMEHSKCSIVGNYFWGGVIIALYFKLHFFFSLDLILKVV